MKTPINARHFERIAAANGPCELVRGKVVPVSPGGLFHGGISFRVAQLLGNWADNRRAGRVFVNETGVITERKPDTVRGVDVAYYSFDRLPASDLPEGFTDIPPTLAVEIVGKGQGWNKMIEKAAEYLRMGVDRVWIIDPKKRCLCILRPDDEPVMVGEQDNLTDPQILPGFRCRVRQFFG